MSERVIKFSTDLSGNEMDCFMNKQRSVLLPLRLIKRCRYWSSGRPTFQRCVLPTSWGSTHHWNVGRQLFYTAVHPRRQFWTSYSPPWELEISRCRYWFTDNEQGKKLNENWYFIQNELNRKKQTSLECLAVMVVSNSLKIKVREYIGFESILHDKRIWQLADVKIYYSFVANGTRLVWIHVSGLITFTSEIKGQTQKNSPHSSAFMRYLCKVLTLKIVSWMSCMPNLYD
jgi:hypothetical protein